MLRNYIRFAFRNFRKYKFHSFVNILGLTIGITAVILISLFIKFHYSFDNFHDNLDNIYRVSIESERNGESRGNSPVFVAPLAEAMYNDIPGITDYCRVSTPRSSYFYSDNIPYKISGICFADSTLFNMFSFDLYEGYNKTALANPFSIVLTETESERIFGNVNPLGKTLLLDNKTPYTVTAVAKDAPANSHLEFNALISFSTLYSEPGHYMDWNGGNQYIHYVTLANSVNPDEIEAKLPEFMWKYINKDLADIGIKLTPELQSFADIHLKYADNPAELMTNIKIFSVVALLILIIASANFINFSTAKSVKRSGEIGIRKVLGAHRTKLVYQVLTESLLVTTLAVMLSLILVELVLPAYRNLLGEQIPSYNLFNTSYLAGIISIIFITGILAGFYPAIHLTRFEPVKVLHGTSVTGKSKTIFRNTLIVVQYTIAIALILTTTFVIQQLNLIEHHDTGFNKNDILVLNLSTTELQDNSTLLKAQISNLPSVKSVAAASDIPYKGFTSNGYFPEGYSEPVMINVVDVDADFLNTFDLSLVEGRNFPDNIGSSTTDYIVNEAFARTMDWQRTVGKSVERNGNHIIRGVVKDFNFASLYNEIKPLIITSRPYRNRFDYLAVKMNMSNVSRTLNNIERIWSASAPNNPLEYWFLDDAFNQTYKDQVNFRKGFSVLSILALVIAVLGLIGLTSFTTEQRIKEIGIRKILGASVFDVVKNLSKTYIYIVSIAIAIAWTASYYFVSMWLEQFAYRIDQSYLIYLLTGLTALIIAAATTTAVVLKAANANPVDALKYE